MASLLLGNHLLRCCHCNGKLTDLCSGKVVGSWNSTLWATKLVESVWQCLIHTHDMYSQNYTPWEILNLCGCIQIHTQDCMLVYEVTNENVHSISNHNITVSTKTLKYYQQQNDE